MRNPCFDVATHNTSDWYVNGEIASDDVGEILDEKTNFEIQSWGSDNCPHCKSSLQVSDFTDVAEGNSRWHNDRTYVVQRCLRCAYWEFHGTEGGNKCMDPNQTILLGSVAAQFNSHLPEACSGELAQHLRRNPTYWHDISPKRMETFVADVFRANYTHSEVTHVGRPGDRGIDVVFVESSGTRWLVQVKRRERGDRAEEFATLQSILGTLVLEGERHGIIVSTADHFSSQVRKGQKDALSQGYVVELYDKGKLDRMIGPLLPEIPWGKIFGHASLQHIEEDVRRHFWGPEADGQLRLF